MAIREWTSRHDHALRQLYRPGTPTEDHLIDLAIVLHCTPKDLTQRALQLGLAGGGAPAATQTTKTRSTAKRGTGGRRSDLGNRYFRSTWEANYARWLRFLVDQRQIKGWSYEPKTFEFPVKRGNRSYKPDFLVLDNDETRTWHEVKGWMDDSSRVKLERFARYFPTERLIVVDAAMYKGIAAQARHVVPNWEQG